MNILAFDCSTTGCSAAIVVDDHVAARAVAPSGVGQAEALLPLVAEVMAAACVQWRDIGLIGVTVGPGSFTGLRIGLAAARGLGLAASVPIAGITTTEAVAAATSPDERLGRTLLVAIESRRADLFVQPFAADLAPLAPVAAMLPEDAARLVAGPVLLAGDGAARLAPLLPAAARSAAAPHPDAAVVARVAAARYAAGTHLPAHPLYLRPADVTLPT